MVSEPCTDMRSTIEKPRRGCVQEADGSAFDRCRAILRWIDVSCGHRSSWGCVSRLGEGLGLGAALK